VKKKQVIMAAVALAGLILILFWVQGGFHSKVPGGTTLLKGPTPQSLKTAVAEALPSVGEVTVSGTVTSREVAQIASRVSGYVVELRVDAGDKVEKGQLLLSVDSKEMAERESQAKAALESARAELVRTRNDFERYKVLFEKESVAKKDYDDALARYDVARATEEKAVAALEEAGTMLSYGKVAAPFDGIVGERSVNVGDLATPGRVLLTVYMPGTLEMVAAAGEQYAPFLKRGGPGGPCNPLHQPETEIDHTRSRSPARCEDTHLNGESSGLGNAGTGTGSVWDAHLRHSGLRGHCSPERGPQSDRST